MTDERFQCLATASLLRSGRSLAIASLGAVLLLGTRAKMPLLMSPAALVSLACWVIALYLAVRVHIDAELFTLLAEGGSPAQLDEFLSRSGLKAASGNRSLEDRIRGAVRLWRFLAATVSLQVLGLLLAW